jgi:hypothetical protein
MRVMSISGSFVVRNGTSLSKSSRSRVEAANAHRCHALGDALRKQGYKRHLPVMKERKRIKRYQYIWVVIGNGR